MRQFKIMRLKRINSEGQIERSEKIITANSPIGAKQKASKTFPTKGRWYKLFNGQYVKGTIRYKNSVQVIVIPL